MGRVRSVVARANQKLTVQIAAALLASSTLISSALGVYRERFLNANYLDTYKVGLDAYTAAFTIPDFMFFILVSGALSVTFIPVFNQRLATGNKRSAWELSSSLINLMALSTLLASVLIIIFAEPLVSYVVGPGFNEQAHGLAVSLMRVIAINPFLFAISAVIASMQQAIGRFFFYTMAPIIYNISIIIGTVYFTNGVSIFGWEIIDGGIMGVAFGVVLGSILQLVVSSVGLIGVGFDYQFKIFWRNQGFKQVMRLLPPRSLDQGMDYIVGIVGMNIASRLGTGMVRVYQQASMLSMMPINLIGVAISTAAFPKMTERLSQGRPDLFKKDLSAVLRVIVWLSLPVAAITFFTRGYVVNFISNDSDVNYLIAGLLGALVLAILFRSIYYIAARSFYAQQDTKTPLYISFFSIGLNIVTAILFTMYLDMGVYGLAWAQSIVAATEAFILFFIMSRRIPGLFDFTLIHAIGRMLMATAAMSVATYVMVVILPLSATDDSIVKSFPKFAIITAVSFACYVAVSRLFQLSEAQPIISIANKFIFGKLRSGGS